MNSCPVITLTTDFGIDDGYVPSLKGVILGINPEARIVDICHTIKPQDILEAAFIVGSVFQYFPPGSIHVIVVDPGVGSSRKALLLETCNRLFIAPDNGVLSYILVAEVVGKSGTRNMGSRQMALYRKRIPQNCRLIQINNPDYWLKSVSNTFHGRDIFAPVAAYLSQGMPIEKFGTPLHYINIFCLPLPYMDSSNRLHGQVMHIDSFGNLITNIGAEDLKKKSIKVKLGRFSIGGLQKYYAEGLGLMAIIGSSNYLEIALKNGSARDYLGANTGDMVQIEFT